MPYRVDRIDPRRTAMIVVDMQSDFVAPGAPMDAARTGLIDGTPGADIYPELEPAPDEPIVKKHRYSAFFGTELDLILREWGIDTVIVSGTSTENCCQATPRDAMFRNYRVVFLSDLTATYAYPNAGYGAMSAAQVQAATLTILAYSTAHVMTLAEMMERVRSEIGARPT